MAPGADLQGGLRGLQPPLLPKTPWKIEVRRREKKRKERREEEERGGWRKKKGDEPPQKTNLGSATDGNHLVVWCMADA